MTVRNEFSVWATRRREEMDKTQAVLSEELGVSQSTLNKWENGVMLPRKDKWQVICDCYGIDMEELKKMIDPSYKSSLKLTKIGKITVLLLMAWVIPTGFKSLFLLSLSKGAFIYYLLTIIIAYAFKRLCEMISPKFSKTRAYICLEKFIDKCVIYN